MPLMRNSAERALEVVKARQLTYGHPADVYKRVARLWSAYLDKYLKPEDVALMMVLLKMGREMNWPNEDNLTDMVGYVLVFEKILNDGVPQETSLQTASRTVTEQQDQVKE